MRVSRAFVSCSISLQARAAVLTAAQCATYNEAKIMWMNATNGGDTLSTHVGASMISGLVTTTLTAPVDVIKTNMFVGEFSWLNFLPSWLVPWLSTLLTHGIPFSPPSH